MIQILGTTYLEDCNFDLFLLFSYKIILTLWPNFDIFSMFSHH